MRPLDLSGLEPPIVVVPVESWSLLTEKALRFAMQISPEVVAVHVGVTEEREQALREQWQQEVEQPARRAGLPVPRLVVIDSPYRRLFAPLIDYVRRLEREHSNREIAVIIPELVQQHWYEALLHGHRAEVLKARLLLDEDQRIVLINVPWYLR
jgi:hypothetical protein